MQWAVEFGEQLRDIAFLTLNNSKLKIFFFYKGATAIKIRGT